MGTVFWCAPVVERSRIPSAAHALPVAATARGDHATPVQAAIVTAVGGSPHPAQQHSIFYFHIVFFFILSILLLEFMQIALLKSITLYFLFKHIIFWYFKQFSHFSGLFQVQRFRILRLIKFLFQIHRFRILRFPISTIPTSTISILKFSKLENLWRAIIITHWNDLV